LALRNALRYFPPDTQELLAPEFAQELRLYGHIYMYRFCPDIEMKAYPVEQYACRTRAAAAIMHMIMNNLDPAVAQGAPCSCLFRNSASAPRHQRWYGQMTAGSYCYIGPQGIVHGTVDHVEEARKRKEALSLGYHGNVVALWERLVRELDTTGELLVDLGSDQTSCHNPFNGGYYPVQLGFAEAQSLMASDPAAFKALVQERVMGSLAHGRPSDCWWTCLPNIPRISQLSPFSPQVVGSQARILYSDQKGRVALAMAFNQAIARGKIK
ncbi:Urocanate hydratase, partial [Eschrichtius robustus]|nr:Urocanate hydratase [Eschrichtius robustus]